MQRSLVLLSTLLVLPAARWAADEQPECCCASTHPMQYLLAQPATSDRRYPILIALAGADADFLGHARRFLAARGDRPVVLIVPCTFSSANAIVGSTCDHFREVYDAELIGQVGGGWIPNVRSRLAWDEAGLLAVIRDLRRQGMQGDVHLTGFSAGGMLAWWMALRHPELFASVMPVCSNFPFWSIGRTDAAKSSSRHKLRILAISGERDPLRRSRVGLPMPPTGVTVAGMALLVVAVWLARRRGWRCRHIAVFLLPGVLLASGLIVGRWSGNEIQTRWAVELLRELGYIHVEWTIQPGMVHEPAAREVLDHLESGKATN